MQSKVTKSKHKKIGVFKDLSVNDSKPVSTRHLGLKELKKWIKKPKLGRTREDLEKAIKSLRGELKGVGAAPSSYDDEEIDAIGQALIKWLDLSDKENGEPIIHLSQFYVDFLGWTPSEYQNTNKSNFERYRQLAEVKIGKKIALNRDFPVAYGNRWLPIYFKEIAEHERKDYEHKIDYEAKAKKDMQLGEVPNASLLTDLFSAVKEMSGKLSEVKGEA